MKIAWKVAQLIACCALLALPQLAQAAEAKLVKLDTPRGVKQALILMKPDKAPAASLILFAGGHGRLNLKTAQSMGWGAGNFLVRTRENFVRQGFTVAVADAPSDRSDGMPATFRMSRDHASDVRAIIAHLKKEANVPVWVVGTSMGTFSAANAAILAAGADGLVLTSTITRAKPDWKIAGSHPNGVASMPLDKVTIPTFVLSHAKDGCNITPAADGPKLQKALKNAAKVEMKLLNGGGPAQSDPCEAKSEHGFLGIEEQAIAAISEFIKMNSK